MVLGQDRRCVSSAVAAGLVVIVRQAILVRHLRHPCLQSRGIRLPVRSPYEPVFVKGWHGDVDLGWMQTSANLLRQRREVAQPRPPPSIDSDGLDSVGESGSCRSATRASVFIRSRTALQDLRAFHRSVLSTLLRRSESCIHLFGLDLIFQFGLPSLISPSSPCLFEEGSCLCRLLHDHCSPAGSSTRLFFYVAISSLL